MRQLKPIVVQMGLSAEDRMRIENAAKRDNRTASDGSDTLHFGHLRPTKQRGCHDRVRGVKKASRLPV